MAKCCEGRGAGGRVEEMHSREGPAVVGKVVRHRLPDRCWKRMEVNV